MTRFRYRPVKQFLSSPELGPYVSYGIHAFLYTDSGCREFALLFDISCDGALVTDLAEEFTRHQLHPVHLMDAVMDAIS
ncbi:DUF6514 family protein [Pseudoflavonifractor phocaeensis]|uniref:DUF6514 family protein n=1 Tax=Pseudoflavonifractor phocaeensis TaxID=1870988 RepID=UPI00308D54F2|nr:hypothetical protein CE91St43_19970 [Oscillospiraceae bacterium]